MLKILHVFVLGLVLCWTFVHTIHASDPHHLRHLATSTNTADSSTNSHGSDPSLCGETLHRQTGFLNGLYYIFYESTSKLNPHEIPVILWLSGGPGCSGLIAALFELGPCSFDDEANAMSLNAYAWTNIAHVIFVDQPKGTGFSDSWANLINDDISTWKETTAMHDLATLVDRFFSHNPALSNNDFYIMGESFAGHYVPDLAVYLLQKKDPQWKRLKGVAIGNGAVSPLGYLKTQLDFALHNRYAIDIVNRSNIEYAQDLQAQALDANTACQQQQHSDICEHAADLSSEFESIFVTGVLSAGHNMYDIRRPCHFEDIVGLCYWFSRLQEYVNQPRVLKYFGISDRKWSLCNTVVVERIRKVDENEDSSRNVAILLEQGLRVLVYAGDADSMAPWNMQKQWTHDMEWDHQQDFVSASVRNLTLRGKQVGTIQTSYGLSLVRIYDSGHMVPHDQPEVSLEMIRNFIDHDIFT